MIDLSGLDVKNPGSARAEEGARLELPVRWAHAKGVVGLPKHHVDLSQRGLAHAIGGRMCLV